MGRPWCGSAVLCVGLQESWVGSKSNILATFSGLPEAVQRVFMAARACGMPLVHIRAKYTHDASPWVPFFKSLNPEKPAYEVTMEPADWAQHLPGETIIAKPTYDAFVGTDLDGILKSASVEHV